MFSLSLFVCPLSNLDIVSDNSRLCLADHSTNTLTGCPVQCLRYETEIRFLANDQIVSRFRVSDNKPQVCPKCTYHRRCNSRAMSPAAPLALGGCGNAENCGPGFDRFYPPRKSLIARPFVCGPSESWSRVSRSKRIAMALHSETTFMRR